MTECKMQFPILTCFSLPSVDFVVHVHNQFLEDMVRQLKLQWKSANFDKKQPSYLLQLCQRSRIGLKASGWD